MTPAFHYLTNHFLEDYILYGPIYFLIEEGAESIHFVHRRFALHSTRGKPISGKEKHNTWENILKSWYVGLKIAPDIVKEVYFILFYI